VAERRRRSLSRASLAFRKSDSAATRRGLTIAIAVTTALAAAVILATCPEPLPFSAGRIADREIRLKRDVRLANESRTRNDRERAARTAPLVFTLDPQPVADLAQRLVRLSREIGRTESFEDLPQVVQLEWPNLITPENFSVLSSVLAGEGRELDFAARLDAVIKPLADDGIVDAASFPPDLDRDTDDIEVWAPATQSSSRRRRSEVLLSELLRVNGPLMERVARQWPPAPAEVIFRLISSRLTPTLSFNAEKTRDLEDEYRLTVSEVIDTYPRGYLVTPQGERIDPAAIRLLEAEHRLVTAERSVADRAGRLTGFILVVTALTVSIAFYISVYARRIAGDPVKLGLLALGFVGTLLLARLLTGQERAPELLPVTVAAFFLAITFDRAFALVLTFALAVLTSLDESAPMSSFLVMLGGTATGISLLDSVRSRKKLIVVGAVAGFTFAALYLGTGLLLEEPWPIIVEESLWRAIQGLAAGFLASGLLPFYEKLSGVTTDISLLELADTSHPLLQELIRRAPGTYNHSATVSIIAEAAAAGIGCNALVCRVGALYHDIGKMFKPEYFIENRTGRDVNRHDRLEPAMSTLIIIGHVKDGVDLALEHNLPQPIVELIEQHHGTTLVDFFYREATREMRAIDDPEEEVEEASFRYPGPKPQSKEAAVLMLADCVEGASRAMNEPTPASIEKLVRRLSMARLLDGQFSESGLTLEEIRAIEDNLIKSLSAVYHGRIVYPEAG
jgi:hypothetical protein